MLRDIRVYLSHQELCELLGVPPGSGILIDDPPLFWRPDVEMWLLSAKAGSQEDIEAAIAAERG